MNDEKQREHALMIKKNIEFISFDLSDIRRSITPQEYCPSLLTQSFKGIEREIEAYIKRYLHILEILEGMKSYYPMEHQKNVLEKISTVRKAIKGCEEILVGLKNLQEDIKNLPVRLFS